MIVTNIGSMSKRRTRLDKINAKHSFSYSFTHDVKRELKENGMNKNKNDVSVKLAVKQDKDNERQNIFKPFIRSLTASALILVSLVVIYSFL